MHRELAGAALVLTVVFGLPSLSLGLMPACGLSATKRIVAAGEPFAIGWSTTQDPTQVFITTIGAVPGTGSRIVKLYINTTFTLTAKNATGVCSQSVYVSVYQPQPETPDTSEYFWSSFIRTLSSGLSQQKSSQSASNYSVPYYPESRTGYSSYYNNYSETNQSSFTDNSVYQYNYYYNDNFNTAPQNQNTEPEYTPEVPYPPNPSNESQTFEYEYNDPNESAYTAPSQGVLPPGQFVEYNERNLFWEDDANWEKINPDGTAEVYSGYTTPNLYEGTQAIEDPTSPPSFIPDTYVDL